MTSPLFLRRNAHDYAPNLRKLDERIVRVEARRLRLGKKDMDGPERLHDITEALLELPKPERAIKSFFDVMERMPEADLGTPGPLVHTLEKLPGYQTELAASIKRIPTHLSLWMVNRILNVTKVEGDREHWLKLFSTAAKHPCSTERAKRDALHFIEYQNR